MRLNTLLFLPLLASAAQAVPRSHTIPLTGGRVLVIEALTDDLVRGQVRPAQAGSMETTFIDSGPAYPGPRVFQAGPNRLTTASLSLVWTGGQLVVSRQGQQVASFAPEGRQLRLSLPKAQALYGLGEQLHPERVGEFDGDWKGTVRFSGESLAQEHPYGNSQVGFQGGQVGNAGFPVLYAQGKPAFMLFLDTPARQRWDFRQHPYTVELNLPDPPFYLAVDGDLRGLRKTYMGVVGRPPVPPRKAFGLWVSEYGFEDWGELRDKLKSLRQKHFPVDGFVLDLQWFGGIQEGSEASSMGRLQFDETRFPRPQETIRALREQDRVGIIPIEESYISKGLPEFADLARRGLLARDPETGEALVINENPWWGIGGMLDHSNPECNRYWHQTKRQPLIQAGVMGHWTDLGEPEHYRHKRGDGTYQTPRYALGNQTTVHNQYAFRWAEGIHANYAASQERQRPFILTRSGAPGIQRFGAAMWSGDIGTNQQSLASHYNAQMHVSMSGIDYYGSDVGGFHRSAFQGTPEQFADLYTQWFADACATDIPLRPHTMNLENPFETAPDRVGDAASNLENLRLRYRLIPYYYSLAHLAHRSGEAVVAPPAYYDPGFAAVGNLKCIGPSLLVGLTARQGQDTFSARLPRGEWVDLRTHQRHRGTLSFPLRQSGIYRLPYLLKAGAILPMMSVTPDTLDAFGHTPTGSTDPTLIVRAASGPASSFTLYEDDGQTIDYQHGKVALTQLSQETSANSISITVGARQGSFTAAGIRRPIRLEVSLPPGRTVQQALLDGQPVRVVAQNGQATVQTAALPTARAHKFQLKLDRP